MSNIAISHSGKESSQKLLNPELQMLFWTPFSSPKANTGKAYNANSPIAFGITNKSNKHILVQIMNQDMFIVL